MNSRNMSNIIFVMPKLDANIVSSCHRLPAWCRLTTAGAVQLMRADVDVDVDVDVDTCQTALLLHICSRFTFC